MSGEEEAEREMSLRLKQLKRVLGTLQVQRKRSSAEFGKVLY